MRRSLVSLVVLLLLSACAGDVATEPAGTSEPAASTEAGSSATPLGATPIITAISTLPPSPTPTVNSTVVRSKATWSPTPTPTETPIPISTPLPVKGSVLIAHGDREMLTLSQIGPEGEIWPLGGSLPISDADWASPRLSPDGDWLAYLASDSEDFVIVNLHTREEIVIDGDAVVSVPMFDPTSRQLAYTVERMDTYTWTIHLRDMVTGEEARLVSPKSVRRSPYDEPLPGKPIAWVDHELLVDTFGPEAAHLGVWAVDASKAISGESIGLPQYDRSILKPQGTEYLDPILSLDNRWLAFVTWSYDYLPSCRDDSPGSTTGVGVVSVAGGAMRRLVDVTNIDGSVFGWTLAWSPDGSQILFAEETCRGASAFSNATLRTVDLQGKITHEWPTVRLGDDCCQEAEWCTPGLIYYLDGRDQLWQLNVQTGQAELVLTDNQIRILGCLP